MQGRIECQESRMEMRVQRIFRAGIGRLRARSTSYCQPYNNHYLSKNLHAIFPIVLIHFTGMLVPLFPLDVFGGKGIKKEL